MSIAVVIGTFGDDRWRDLAMSRAYPSALANDAAQIYVVHGDTLAQARNDGARQARIAAYSHLCFLDADDELAPGYLDAMGAAIRDHSPGFVRKDFRLYTPQVEYVHGRKHYRARFNRQIKVEDGNWLVIGTVIGTSMFEDCGGFEEWPLYEDWALFARAQKRGAAVVEVPDAVYVAHRSHGSRNHPTRPEKLAAHDMIRRAVFPELYEEVA